MDFTLFSKRNYPKKFDAYIFDHLSKKFRNQIYYVWKEHFAIQYFENIVGNLQYDIFNLLEETICKEHGLLRLADEYNPLSRCISFLLKNDDVLQVLDIIELSLRFRENIEDFRSVKKEGMKYKVSDMIEEVNERFKENGLGYAYINGQLLKKDNEHLYQNAIKPALTLINEMDFKGTEDEFLQAFEYYKIGKNKEAITSSSKAFESAMKTICYQKGWSVQKNTAANLIKVIFQKELIPTYMQTHLNSLKTTLEGLPTLRNKNGGHGQGYSAVEVNQYFVEYALNLTATNIVFLIKAYKKSL